MSLPRGAMSRSEVCAVILSYSLTVFLFFFFFKVSVS